MADQVTSHCDRIVSNILSTYKMAIQHGTAENQEDTAKFIKLVEEVCRLEHLCENESNAATNTEFDNIDTIDQEFTDLIEQCQSSVTKQMIEASARYRNFMHEFDDLKAAASQAQATNKEARATTSNTTVIDEDLQMGTTESLIDPIAKTQIKNPYRNRICRHLYDYETITGALKMNPNIRCPYVGCANKQKLRVQDLVEDRELRHRIMQKQNESELSMQIDDD